MWCVNGRAMYVAIVLSAQDIIDIMAIIAPVRINCDRGCTLGHYFLAIGQYSEYLVSCLALPLKLGANYDLAMHANRSPMITTHTINDPFFTFFSFCVFCYLASCSVRSVMQKYLEKENEISFDKLFNQILGYLLFKDFCESMSDEPVPQLKFYEEVRIRDGTHSS